MKKKVFITICGFIIVLGIAFGIFYFFFFDAFLNNYVRSDLIAAVEGASKGQYELQLGEVYIHKGTVICRKFDLVRVRFDSLTDGIYVNRISMDSVVLAGLNWWRILVHKKIELSRLQFDAPVVSLSEASSLRKSDTASHTTVKFSEPRGTPLISIDSIVLNNIKVNMPTDSNTRGLPTIEGASIAVSHFCLDTASNRMKDYLYFSEGINITVPEIKYVLEDSLYTLSVRNLHANFLDSSLTVDTLSYRPNYADKAFISKFPFRRDRLDFIWTGIKLNGVELQRLFGWRGIIFKSGSVNSWSFDYYSDKRKPLGLPQHATFPNEAVRDLGHRIFADSLTLHNGFARVREQHFGSPDQAILIFTKIEAVIHPLDVQPKHPQLAQPSHIAMSTAFLGTSVNSIITLPVSQSAVDLDIHTTVGGFDAKKLNPFLKIADRTEVTEGVVESGEVTMKIRNGMATTTVTPTYHSLSMRVLAEKDGESRGIMEGLKTFIFNTFKLRSDNSPTEGGTLKSATTTRMRKKGEEFFQYLWFCIRKSLGQVVGGFE